MPIPPEVRALYPANWKTHVRPAVLRRAGHRCEGCGVRQYAVGYRDEGGRFIELGRAEVEVLAEARRRGEAVPRVFQIALSVAHRDHDPRNNDGMERGGPPLPFELSNLFSACQRCHNLHDAAHRRRNRARTRLRVRGVLPLPFPGLEAEIYGAEGHGAEGHGAEGTEAAGAGRARSGAGLPSPGERPIAPPAERPS